MVEAGACALVVETALTPQQNRFLPPSRCRFRMLCAMLCLPRAFLRCAFPRRARAERRWSDRRRRTRRSLCRRNVCKLLLETSTAELWNHRTLAQPGRECQNSVFDGPHPTALCASRTIVLRAATGLLKQQKGHGFSIVPQELRS